MLNFEDKRGGEIDINNYPYLKKDVKKLVKFCHIGEPEETCSHTIFSRGSGIQVVTNTDTFADSVQLDLVEEFSKIYKCANRILTTFNLNTIRIVENKTHVTLYLLNHKCNEITELWSNDWEEEDSRRDTVEHVGGSSLKSRIDERQLISFVRANGPTTFNTILKHSSVPAAEMSRILLNLITEGELSVQAKPDSVDTTFETQDTKDEYDCRTISAIRDIIYNALYPDKKLTLNSIISDTVINNKDYALGVLHSMCLHGEILIDDSTVPATFSLKYGAIVAKNIEKRKLIDNEEK